MSKLQDFCLSPIGKRWQRNGSVHIMYTIYTPVDVEIDLSGRNAPKKCIQYIYLEGETKLVVEARIAIDSSTKNCDESQLREHYREVVLKEIESRK